MLGLKVNKGLQEIPMRQPFFDTEWLDDGATSVEFFRQSNIFASPKRGDKSRHHCNMYGPAWPCAKGMRFFAYRLVVFPTTEGVREPLAEYRARVEAYRQSATCKFMLGYSTVKLEVPLADACANIAPPDFVLDPSKVPEEFDPTEAPEINYRRGVDLTISNQPYFITDSEVVSVRLDGPPADGIGFRCYLAGVLLKAITQ